VSKLLEEWAPRVYRFALRLCDDPHAAEDLTQETFLRAWRHRARLRDERATAVWLFRISVNIWRDQLRRGRSRVAQACPLEDDEPSRAHPPAHMAAAREELSRALEAMAELPPRQREVLYLGACEGMPTAEIGEVLGVSADAVKANLSLARKRMRVRLHDLVPDSAQLE
jgi:RNA polymerase sigma-70 factor (ECF subfamily)